MMNWIKKHGGLCVLLCYICWGFLPIYWKQIDSLDPVYILSGRIFWSVIFCGILLLVTGQAGKAKEALKDKGEALRLFFAGVAVCITWGLYIYAVVNDHVLDGSLAYYMCPLFTIGLAFLFYKERLSGLQLLSLAIALAGILAVIFAHGEFPWLAVIIGMSFAVYSTIKKRVKAEGLVSTFVESLFLSPLALAYMVWAEGNGTGALAALEGAELLYLPLSGVVTAIPLLFFAYGVKHISMALAGILMYVNPTLQMLVGILVYGEELDPSRMVLFACVWTALILFVWSNNRKSKGKELRTERE
ncbi:MAG: EamA family transporter RarD [Firmicutes bacterium]|nr:EamA family transporter RarD [Bacillota bacterium]